MTTAIAPPRPHCLSFARGHRRAHSVGPVGERCPSPWCRLQPSVQVRRCCITCPGPSSGFSDLAVVLIWATRTSGAAGAASRLDELGSVVGSVVL